MPATSLAAQARTTVVRPADPTLRSALRLALAFAAVKLALHIVTTLIAQHLGYSYFRDEFYYIICGRRLAWGYVDHGPLVAIQARLAEALFGTSLLGIRLLSALAGAIMVFLTGILAWALGGRRSAQFLAMLGVLLAPQFLGADSFLSMNSVEPVFWMSCLLALITAQRRLEPAPAPNSAVIATGAAGAPNRPLHPPATRLPETQALRTPWILFGISAGLGLLNKPSMTFFLVALLVGLLLTPQRSLLFTRWTALAVTILVLIALPNLLWQLHHGWPTLEFLHNGRVGHKNVELPFLPFLRAQIDQFNPLSTLLWITGVVSLLRARSILNMRWIGLAFLVFFTLMFKLHAKDYYLAPFYPVLFAAGAIAWQHRFARTEQQRNALFAFPIYETALLVTGLLILPMAIPILPPQTWLAYTRATHLYGKSGNTETAPTGPFPQFYADRFGWQQEVNLVNRAFLSLSPEDRARVTIFANNYGEAGAIDFLGARQHLGLPAAISGQNTYWLWGPGNRGANLVIAVVQDSPEQLHRKYASVTIVGRMDHPYAMPWEHKNVYLLRNRLPGEPFSWADEKVYF